MCVCVRVYTYLYIDAHNYVIEKAYSLKTNE